jgi:hypothetical protein
MRHTFVTWLGWPALCLATACSGPEFLETRLVSNTNDTGGGYEVRTLIRDLKGVNHQRVRLLYTGVPSGQDTGSSASVSMARVDDDTAREGDRFIGAISGFPMGTTVRYGMEACNRLGRCTLEPEGFPQTQAFSFVVGTLPSSPLVLAVIPARGPTVGGIRVQLDGEDFRPGMEIFFDGNPAVHAEVIRPTMALCLLPQGRAGIVDVAVRNPDGQTAVLRQSFTYYNTPRPIRVIPNEGPTQGGTPVVVEGEFFVQGSRVTFDGRHV